MKKGILYFLAEALFLGTVMSVTLHYFTKQSWKNAIFIGGIAALITVANNWWLYRKKKNNK